MKKGQYSRFFALITPYSDKIALSLVVSLFLQLGIIVQPLILKGLFDYAFYYKDFNLVLFFGCIPFILALSFKSITTVQSLVDLFVNQELYYKLYKIIYSKINRLPMHFFHRHRVGDLIYRMTDDLEAIEDTLLTIIPTMINTILKIIFLLMICLTFDATLTLFALIGVPLHMYETYFFSRRLRALNKKNQRINGQLYDILEERLSNIKLIKLLQRWTTEVTSLLSHISRLFLIERRIKVSSLSHSFMSICISRTWMFLIAIYIGLILINNTISVGDTVAIMSYILMMQTPFNILFKSYTQLHKNKVSFQRINTILDCPNEDPENQGEQIQNDIKGDIRFDNVSFHYVQEQPILHHISFEVKKGESLAIIGKSGIGKSSIIDLLLRFYTPNSGQILLDNTSITNVDITHLRQHIGLISQDACLFYGTIKDNITFGVEDVITDEEIFRAAKKADAHDFITSLPKGYDSPVGPRGANLSSGQRQRIAIARALLKDPPILIFDEAISALDSESEQHIQRTLESLKRHKTVIIIAHRLSSIKHVDNVIVIGNDGHIAQQGNLITLMNEQGIFQKLYDIQLGGFQQFVTQVHFLIASSHRYKTPFSLSLLEIADYDQIMDSFNEGSLDHLIENLSITINLFTHETDLCCYHKEGRFWLAFPHTDSEGAEKATKRLADYINDVWFESYKLPHLKLHYAFCQAEKAETFHSLSDKVYTSLSSFKTDRYTIEEHESKEYSLI